MPGKEYLIDESKSFPWDIGTEDKPIISIEKLLEVDTRGLTGIRNFLTTNYGSVERLDSNTDVQVRQEIIQSLEDNPRFIPLIAGRDGRSLLSDDESLVNALIRSIMIPNPGSVRPVSYYKKRLLEEIVIGTAEDKILQEFDLIFPFDEMPQVRQVRTLRLQKIRAGIIRWVSLMYNLDEEYIKY